MNFASRVLSGVAIAASLVVISDAANDSAMASEPVQQSPAWALALEAAPDSRVIADPEIRKRIAATGLPWRVRDLTCGIEMLLIPPGTFVMGASDGDADATASEKPAHEVVISRPFYLSRNEVTQEQWLKAMPENPSRFQQSTFQADAEFEREAEIAKLVATGITRREAQEKLGPARTNFDSTAKWPVESMTEAELQAFLAKTSLQLPSEAQWEYACRAGTTTPTYGALEVIAWCGANSEDHPHLVGTMASNAFGMHDMLGNVWEWCGDYFDADAYSKAGASVSDPKGPTSGNSRVLRGGNWLSLPRVCRASARIEAAPGSPAYGFRVAREAR